MFNFSEKTKVHMLSPERRNRDSRTTFPTSYSSQSINMEADDISESKSKFRRLLGVAKDGRIDPVQLALKLLQSAKDNHSIEFLMFFHMVGYTCTTVIVQNLYIDRICRLDYKFDPEICR